MDSLPGASRPTLSGVHRTGSSSVGDEGADADKVLEVLHKAVELDEFAARDPVEGIVAKGRESEVLPPEIREAMVAAYLEAEQRTKRKGLLWRLFGGA